MAMHCLWVADYKGKSIKGGPDHRAVAMVVGRCKRYKSLLSIGGRMTWATLRFVPPLSDDYKRHIVYSRR